MNGGTVSDLLSVAITHVRANNSSTSRAMGHVLQWWLSGGAVMGALARPLRATSIGELSLLFKLQVAEAKVKQLSFNHNYHLPANGTTNCGSGAAQLHF